MKVGLIVRNSGPEAADALARIPALAEDLGFDSVWVSDHIVVPPAFAERYDAEWIEATVALAFVAARTSRVRVGFSALILPYRPPVVVARQIAAIEHLAPGRLTVAAGSGWLKEEFEALGVPFEERGDRTDAAIGVIRRTARCEVLAAGNGRGVMLRAALLCDGWHPIARTPEEIARGRGELIRLAQKPMRVVLRARFSLQDEPAVRPLYGPPDKVGADLASYAAAGVDEMVLDHAPRDLAGVVAQVERLAGEVLPRSR